MYKNLTEVLQMKNTYLHLYGKKETKPGRKMGHITLLGDNRNQLISTANIIKSLIKVIAK
jgi:5-(carboxyamino)imidazole ribonucleotide synthase